MLKKYKASTHSLTIFKKGDDGMNKAMRNCELGLFGVSSPTWGEINYVAYDMPTIEFHNELYGFIQARAIESDADESHKYWCEDKLDSFLEEYDTEEYLRNNKKSYTRVCRGEPQAPTDVTIPRYIRDVYHHPENTCNEQLSDADIKKSIEILINILKSLQSSDQA